jgi:hypothetical protein
LSLLDNYSTLLFISAMHEMLLVAVVRLKVGDSLVILLFKMFLKVASECNGMRFLVELLVNFIFVF